MSDEYQMRPTRLLRPEERALVAEWLAAAGDVSLAYVSSRKGDGQKLFRRIVITIDEDEEPSYIINAPQGTPLWAVHSYPYEQNVLHYCSLREALNSIRKVLPDPPSIFALARGSRRTTAEKRPAKTNARKNRNESTT